MGQSLTEYAIIVFLIAVGTIGVVGLFGNNLRSLFSSGADAVAGETDVQTGASTKKTSSLTKWSLKGGGGDGFNSGGVMNRPGGGNSGGTSNSPAPADDLGGPSNNQGGGNWTGGIPGGTSNSTNPSNRDEIGSYP